MRARPVTITDVAARAGVSMATVSRVLSGNYSRSAPAQAKVLRAVKELGYVANPHARALAGQTTRTVAVLAPSMLVPFYAAVVQGVAAEAALSDRLSMVCPTFGDEQREARIIEMLRKQGAEAVILVGGAAVTPQHRERMAGFTELLSASGSQLVLCGRPGLGPKGPALVVNYDNEGGACAAASHLIAAGHRRILFLGGIAHAEYARDTTYVPRLNGWRNAHQDHGIEADDDLVVAATHGKIAEVFSQRLAKRDFTAVFAFNDSIALKVLKVARDKGVRVPEDLSVVGYDDTLTARNSWPPLTTVHIPAEELGRAAVRMAVDTDKQTPASTLTLGVHLIERESVAAPRA
ncbi:LacI family DNA-binding transcriptional regulator [Streptomyces sp. NPDC055709]